MISSHICANSFNQMNPRPIDELQALNTNTHHPGLSSEAGGLGKREHLGTHQRNLQLGQHGLSC